MKTRARARATRARRGETECRASTPTFGGEIGRRRTLAPGSGWDATGGAAEDFPAAAWDSRGRKHAWLADYGAGAHLDSVEWEDLPEGPGALQPRAAHEAWASGEDDDVDTAAHEGDVDSDDGA